MRVTLAYSPGPRQVREWSLDLPEGTCVGQALERAGLYHTCPALRDASLKASVRGRAAPATQALREGDRLELLRPLEVDPKMARRERFQRQGSRAAGLFAKKPNGR